MRGMNRREFLRTTGLAAAATLTTAGGSHGAAATGPVATTAPVAPLALPPVLRNVSGDGVTVTWGVAQPATGWVEYGETESLGQTARGAVAGLLPYDDRVLSFRLAGLKPGTRYFYRSVTTPIDFSKPYRIRRGDAVPGEVRSFRTLDPSATSASFTVWNDTHQVPGTLRALCAVLASSPADFLVWNGDIANDPRDEAQIVREYLHPAGQAYADRVPVCFVRGNHDVRGSAARLLDRHIPGPDGRWYHAFRHGPLACLVLDTGEDKPDDHPAYSGLVDFGPYYAEQADWLTTVITQDWFRSAPFRVAFMHIPMAWDRPGAEDRVTWYRPDSHRAYWHAPLVDGRVDLVISGHTHATGWMPATADRPYAQIVGGGPQPERATILTARADATALDLHMTRLAGQTVVRERLPVRR